MTTDLARPRAHIPLYLVLFISGVVWTSLGPLLDSILRDLDIPLEKGGLLALSFFLGTVVGLVVFNAVLARIPVKWCLVGATALQAIGLAFTGALAWSLWPFLIAYFFVGIAGVLLGAVPGMWLSAHVKEDTARVMTILQIASVLGMTSAPVVLGVLLGAGATWRVLYIGEAALTVLVLLVLLALPLADIPDRENLRLSQLRKVVACNSRLLLWIVLAAFLYLGGEMTLCVWLPKFEVDVFGSGATWAGMVVTLFFIGQVIGRVVAVPLTRRFNTATLLTAASTTMAVFAAAVGLAPSQAVSLVLTFAAGLGSSAMFAYIGSYSGRFPAWYGGVVFSAFELSGGIGGMVFPYITGPVAASFGFRAAILVAAVPIIIVALIAFRLRAAAGEGRVRVIA